MRVRKLARRAGQVIAAATFGVVLTIAGSAANADEQTGEDQLPEPGAELEAPGWESEPGEFGVTPNLAPGWE